MVIVLTGIELQILPSREYISIDFHASSDFQSSLLDISHKPAGLAKTRRRLLTDASRQSVPGGFQTCMPLSAGSVPPDGVGLKSQPMQCCPIGSVLLFPQYF